MNRRIVVMPPQAEAEQKPFDSWLPGQGLLEESLALAGIIFAAGEVLIFGLTYVVLPLNEAAMTTVALMPLVAALAAFVALALAVYRVLRYERRERRHLAMMDLQVEHLRRQVEDTGERLTGTRFAEHESGTRYWDQLAYEMLKRYYSVLQRTGDPNQAVHAISRRVCVKDGVCTQTDWNELNRLLQTRGIRGKRFLIPKTFEEAWQLWQEHSLQVSGWYVRDDGVWVPKE